MNAYLRVLIMTRNLYIMDELRPMRGSRLRRAITITNLRRKSPGTIALHGIGNYGSLFNL